MAIHLLSAAPSRWVLFALLVLLPDMVAFASEPAATTSGATSYMPAIRQELARIDIKARCDDATATCVCTKTLGKKARAYTVVVRYSKNTDTIYIYIDKFIGLTDAGPSTDLARRLLELNREMVTAKFEWDRATTSIRLSATINTDSNFDRRAFRSQIQGLWSIAEKLWPNLSALGEDSRQTIDKTPTGE